jgi:heme-degrading monooxygenase HmoA
MAESIQVTLTMIVDDVHAAAFATEWRRVAEFAAGRPGCLAQSLTSHALAGTGTTEFVITSQWADRAAFRRFETSDSQDRATSGLAALRRSVRMEITELSLKGHPS